MNLFSPVKKYPSLQWSSYSVVEEANEFYERIKDKPSCVLEKYSAVVEPKGFFDTSNFLNDGRRKARLAATQRVLSDRKIASLLERKLSE